MKLSAKTIAVVTLGLTVLATALPSTAQIAPKPENLVKWRQSAYQFVAWNSGRIKAVLAGDYNKDEVIAAANAIAGAANSGLPKLFAPGTEATKGWHDTNAKPDAFKDAARLAKLDADFAREANELARLANTGDAAAVKAQYAKLNGTCKACHDAFKAD